MVLANIVPIVVCVNYDDVIALTLERNRMFFKHYVVVTTNEDHKTIEVCRKYDVTLIVSGKLYDNAKFNKSGLVNQAQKQVHRDFPDSWVLLLDADIALPPTFEDLVDPAKLDKSTLYSMHRLDFHTYDDYVSGANPVTYGGQTFMGYFQLYFNKSLYYPEHSYDCSYCDDVFMKYFGQNKAVLSEDTRVSHLGIQDVNWGGRVTPRWTYN
jgi:hypothetical protein